MAQDTRTELQLLRNKYDRLVRAAAALREAQRAYFNFTFGGTKSKLNRPQKDRLQLAIKVRQRALDELIGSETDGQQPLC